VPVLGLTFVKSRNVPGTTTLPLARVHLGETMLAALPAAPGNTAFPVTQSIVNASFCNESQYDCSQ